MNFLNFNRLNPTIIALTAITLASLLTGCEEGYTAYGGSSGSWRSSGGWKKSGSFFGGSQWDLARQQEDARRAERKRQSDREWASKTPEERAAINRRTRQQALVMTDLVGRALIGGMGGSSSVDADEQRQQDQRDALLNQQQADADRAAQEAAAAASRGY